MENITFQKICEDEPEILVLYHLAHEMSANGPELNTDRVWYGLFKPRLYYLVGWGRREISLLAEKWGLAPPENKPDFFAPVDFLKERTEQEEISGILIYLSGISTAGP